MQANDDDDCRRPCYQYTSCVWDLFLAQPTRHQVSGYPPVHLHHSRRRQQPFSAAGPRVFGGAIFLPTVPWAHCLEPLGAAGIPHRPVSGFHGTRAAPAPQSHGAGTS